MLLNSSELQDAINQLKGTVNSKSGREVLQGIHLIQKDNKLICESTNSFVLKRIEIDVDIQELDSEWDITIIPPSIKFNSVRIELNLKDAIIKDGESVYKLDKIELEYPTLDNLFPTDLNLFEISFTVDNLKAMLSGLNKNDVITLKIRDELKVVEVESISTNRKCYKGLLSPTRRTITR